MKQTLLSLLLVLLPIVASAEAVEIDGIYYNLVPKAKVAEVVNPNGSWQSSVYSGEVTIPDTIVFNNVTYNVTSIGNNAFYCCDNLTNVIIPTTVISIGFQAFAQCRLLTSLIIPNSVTSIGGYAFANCSGLISITIPDNVTNIGSNVFINCTGLRTVTLPSRINSISSFLFENCINLTTITIPDSVKTIENGAFYGCKSLVCVSIPNSVTTILGNAFEECSSLTTMTIGNGIKEIYERSFAKCKELTDVFCYAPRVPNIYSDAFNESYIEYVTLHVPESTIDDYKATSPWNGFGKIVPLSPYTLTYYVDGEVYKTYLHEKGIAIPEEPAPEKEGYTFSGWSEIPETMPDHDVEVTGTFTVNKYNLIYMVDGEEYKTVEIEYGAEITPEDGPEKEGYTFKGWNEIPETMPANDVTVNGTFVKNSLGKCATPTIAFKDGKFKFESTEEGVEFVWSITIADSKEGRGNEVDINGRYKVSVYATKEEYEDSDAATIEVDIRGKQGDVSGDGEVDATDITKLIDILLKKNTTTNTEQ